MARNCSINNLFSVCRVLESGRLVAGGGAVEAALNVYLESFATTLVREEEILKPRF